MLKTYFNYIKDNPNGYWFKRKIYGWGWVPARWQGWVTSLVLLGFIFWQVFCLEVQYGPNPTGKPLQMFLIKIFVAVCVFCVLAYWKGEKPKWQWGIKAKAGE